MFICTHFALKQKTKQNKQCVLKWAMLPPAWEISYKELWFSLCCSSSLLSLCQPSSPGLTDEGVPPTGVPAALNKQFSLPQALVTGAKQENIKKRKIVHSQDIITTHQLIFVCLLQISFFVEIEYPHTSPICWFLLHETHVGDISPSPVSVTTGFPEAFQLELSDVFLQLSWGSSRWKPMSWGLYCSSSWVSYV